MEKIDKRIHKHFKHNKFYLEDIKKLYNIFIENTVDVEFETNEYKNINDLDKLKEINVNAITIRSTKPSYITLYLEKDETTFTASCDNVFSRGLLSQIEDILSKTKKKTNFLYGILIRCIIYATMLISSMYFISQYFISIDNSLSEKELYLSYFIFALIYTAVYIIKPFNKNIFIFNKTRVEHSFWHENRHYLKQGIVATFSAIIGGLIVYMVTTTNKKKETDLFANPVEIEKKEPIEQANK